MMWLEMLRGAYIVENTQKTVGKSTFELDTKASNEKSNEPAGPGSPYLTLPVRTLDQAVSELGLDRYGDLLRRGTPSIDEPAVASEKAAVLVHLSTPNIAGNTATALPTRFSQFGGNICPDRNVANAK